MSKVFERFPPAGSPPQRLALESFELAQGLTIATAAATDRRGGTPPGSP